MIERPRPSPSVAVNYSTSAFAVPLTVTVPPTVAPLPDEETERFVTWSSRKDDADKIRFLVPVKYYPVNSATSRPAPRDYAAYISALVNEHATSSAFTSIRVDGSPVKVSTVIGLTTDSGDLGCSRATAAKGSEQCFGLGVEYAVRLAVITRNGKTVLVWARTDASSTSDPLFFGRFDRMLASLKFG